MFKIFCRTRSVNFRCFGFRQRFSNLRGHSHSKMNSFVGFVSPRPCKFYYFSSSLDFGGFGFHQTFCSFNGEKWDFE